jgi:hypothetical protein
MPGRRWLPDTSTPLDMPLGGKKEKGPKFRARAWSWPAFQTLVWHGVARTDQRSDVRCCPGLEKVADWELLTFWRCTPSLHPRSCSLLSDVGSLTILAEAALDGSHWRRAFQPRKRERALFAVRSMMVGRGRWLDSCNSICSTSRFSCLCAPKYHIRMKEARPSSPPLPLCRPGIASTDPEFNPDVKLWRQCGGQHPKIIESRTHRRWCELAVRGAEQLLRDPLIATSPSHSSHSSLGSFVHGIVGIVVDLPVFTQKTTQPSS